MVVMVVVVVMVTNLMYKVQWNASAPNGGGGGVVVVTNLMYKVLGM